MSVRGTSIFWKPLVAGAAVSVVTACGLAVAPGSPTGHHARTVELASTTGQVRTYYIAADQVLWDYAPDGTNDITGKPFTAEEQVFTQNGPNRVGHRYWKSLYRGYTNAGLVGPMVITARGKADPAAAMPTDVDREIFSYFTVENENNSPYLDRNLHPLAGPPHSIPADDEDAFEESNLMPSTVTSTATARCRRCGWASGCAGTPSASGPRSTCTRRTGTATP